MNTIVIYPGRFHPFHRGHKASYDFLAKQFGPDNVYIATSDVQAPITSPFSFEDKQQMISKLGIPTGHVVQVKNPYQATELLSQVADPANTQVIFAVSEKDMQEENPRFKFGLKKDGTPSKLQPMPDNPKQMKPMTDHFYVMVTPTVNFRVQGADANSASQIRNKYANGNDADRDQIITDLYGEAYPELRDLFDKKLGIAKQTQELVAEARIKNPARAVQLLETIKKLESQAQHLDEVELGIYENPDYIEERWSQRYKNSINCSNPKGFSQRAHCAGRKKKVNESSGYSLAGSFTPDLVISKVWLLTELANIAPSVDTVYILGSWYGNLALYMNLQPQIKYDQIINVETDQAMLDQSKRMLDLVGADRIEYMNRNANDLDYRQLGNKGVVINTSLTDMPGTEWFSKIPQGTLVVLQARDQDPGKQFHSPKDIIKKFPLSKVLYSGTKTLKDPETDYHRYMVIGRK